MPVYWSGDSPGSVPVSTGGAEGVQAHPVASKSDSGHGADVSVLDGYLEDLQTLTRSLSSALARRLPDPIAVRWLTELSLIDDFIAAVDCRNGCGRTAEYDMGLDGLLCHACYLHGDASGPDEDADYEEAVGK